jgi:acetyltransferase-like isoleucine patch superfamily enzyme
MDTLILVLVLLLYLRWVAIFLAFPWICLLFQYYKHKGMVRKVLAIPGAFLEKLTVEGVSRYIIIHIGYIPSVKLRLLLYQCLGVNVGKNVVVHYRTEIRAPYRLQLGSGCIIGDNALLDARNGLTIGETVNFSSNVAVYTEQHDHRDEMFRCTKGVDKSVAIGNRVWIGSNVVILPGVKIGEGAVCCAGCVVTKDVAPYDVVAGIPAKKVNTRPNNLLYEFDGKSCWFY